MIGYVLVGTNNLEHATKFYDALFTAIGAKRVYETPRSVSYGTGKGPAFGVVTPFNEQPATFGNGTMVALAVSSPAEVDKLHALALSLGAKDEGAPGPRGGGYYGAYFRDLDGNKLNFFCLGG